MLSFYIQNLPKHCFDFFSFGFYTVLHRDADMLAAAPRPPTSIQQPEQSDARNLISRHALTLSFLITSLFYLLLYILWCFLMHKFISALLHATLIHVALNQHSMPINSLGKHSQLFPLFSESDIALLSENEHSGAQKKNTQLQDVHL